MKTCIFVLFVALAGQLATERKPDAPPVEADFSKVAIEANAERLVGATRLPPATKPVAETVEPESDRTASDRTAAETPVDRSKIAIESGAESLVGTSRGTAPLIEEAHSDRLPTPGAPPTVIRVQPGFVSWHKDYATAQAAARISGKPILLFQLLGNLDEHFT